MPLPPSVGRLNKVGLNKVTARLAGRGPFAELEHVGRRTGAVHRTPIMAFRGRPDGTDVVTFALTYGPRVDWLRNLRAAGGGRLHLGDQWLTLGAPRDLTTDQGMARMPLAPRIILPLTRTTEFVEAPVLGAEPA